MAQVGKISAFTGNMRNKKFEIYEDETVPYFVEGILDTPIGKVRKVSTRLRKKDIFNGWKVRWGINRNKYKLSPGIYAIGNPDDTSVVLVTSNYKFTFDKLRKELIGLNLWIVVLDTKGINVWCAAGKGTFGTTEIINRIKKLRLNKLVSHNTIILPQLGGSGVAAHIVTKISGFKVIYGPVYAKDIPAFIKNELKATEKMREIKFNLIDRIVLTPIEIMNSLKYIAIIICIFLVINLINPGSFDIYNLIKHTLMNSAAYIIAIFIGCFVIPVMLPYIPFRAFSLKGLFLGIAWSLFCIVFSKVFLFANNLLIYIANFLCICAIISYLALNFTGSTTYTSLSGVEKETKITFPAVIIAISIGLLFIIIYKIKLFL